MSSESGSELRGQLSACSHILNSNPVCGFLEVCTDTSVNYIVITDLKKYLVFQDSLTIGLSYKFSNLRPTSINSGTCRVKCYKTSEYSMCHEVQDMDIIYYPPLLNNFFNVKGKVIRVDNEYGVLYLEGSRSVILSSRFAALPTLEEGQEVTIYNVHRLNLQSDTVMHAMCVRSFLSVLRKDTDFAAVPSVKLSPLLEALGGDFLHYQYIVWLQDLSSKIDRSLDNDLLQSFGIQLGDCTDFRYTVLQKILKLVLQKCNVQKFSPFHEFMALDHTRHCSLLANEMVPIPFLNLLEMNEENPSLNVDHSPDGPKMAKMSWKYNVKNYSERFLIGVVAMKGYSHRLTLNDSFGSVPVVVLPQKGHNDINPDLDNINRKVVLISELDVVTEGFAWLEEEMLRSQNYRSLSVHEDKVIILSSLSKDWKLVNIYDTLHFVSQHGTKSTDCVNVTIARQAVSSECSTSNRSNVPNKGCSCISPAKEPLLMKYVSQFIFVQHKTAICVPKQGKPARCYILATLLGEMLSHPRTASDCGKNTRVSKFISLQTSLLGAHPFILVNNVYEIRFPIGFNNIFWKGSILPSVEGLSNILPTVTCVDLPNSCEIHVVKDQKIPSSLKQDCYTIDQVMQQSGSSKLINVVGYIAQRFHQEARFAREMVSVNTNGFGIPGKNVIALVLCDSPSEYLSRPAVTFYLSYWATLQYPIGLLPGMKILARYVVVASTNTKLPYLRSSILTSIEVLNFSSESERCGNYKLQLKPRSFLCSAWTEGSECHLLSVSMAEFHKISLSAFCSACNCPFQNGSCTYTGCVSNGDSKFLFQATFVIKEFGSSPTFVFVPHDQVHKIFSTSEDIWKMILTMVRAFGSLTFFQPKLDSDIIQLSLQEWIFRLFCMQFLSGHRFNLLCRLFVNKRVPEIPVDAPSLYAVDISPITFT